MKAHTHRHLQSYWNTAPRLLNRRSALSWIDAEHRGTGILLFVCPPSTPRLVGLVDQDIRKTVLNTDLRCGRKNLEAPLDVVPTFACEGAHVSPGLLCSLQPQLGCWVLPSQVQLLFYPDLVSRNWSGGICFHALCPITPVLCTIL